MTSYFNACDVTVANSIHKNFLYIFWRALVAPTLKKVPPPMTSIKPNWQGIWTYNAITSLLLNGSFVGRTTDLEKTAKMNWLRFLLWLTSSADTFMHEGNVWAHDELSAVWRNTRKKIDFTREKPMQLPQAPQIQLCSYSLADFFAKRLHRVFSHWVWCKKVFVEVL